MTYTFPAAQRHGELREIFDDVFFVQGAAKVGPPLPMTLSRSMSVVREGESLTLIGSMRLSEEGLERLDALGEVEHVIRLAAFHGMDDPFYKDRYGAKVWAVEGSAYGPGFDTKPKSTYFEPDVWMTEDTELPLAGASLYRFGSATPAEGLLLLEREGGILVSGDALQHLPKPDEYCNWVAAIAMRFFGIYKPHNVGPGWLSAAKPSVDEVHGILDLEFEHVLPVHGAAVVGGAKEKYRPAIERIR